MFRIFSLLILGVTSALAADQATIDQVTDLFKQKKWTEARAILEKVIATEPTNAEAWHHLSETFLALNDAPKALAAAEKATSLDPKQSNYFLQLGHAAGMNALKAGLFSKLGFAKQCKVAYDKAVELDPKNLNARWSLMEYCRQAPGFIGGGMTEAYVQAEQIKKLDARRGRQAYVILYSAEKKYPEAFALYEEVLREKPDDGDALYNIGRLAAVSGEQLDRGLETLRKYLSTEPQLNHARTHTRIGNILEKKGDKPGAKLAYEAALAADPKFVQALEALRKLNAV